MRREEVHGDALVPCARVFAKECTSDIASVHHTQKSNSEEVIVIFYNLFAASKVGLFIIDSSSQRAILTLNTKNINVL